MVCLEMVNLMACELYLHKAAIRMEGKLNVSKVHKDTGISSVHLPCLMAHRDYDCVSHVCLIPHAELLGGRDVSCPKLHLQRRAQGRWHVRLSRLGE